MKKVLLYFFILCTVNYSFSQIRNVKEFGTQNYFEVSFSPQTPNKSSANRFFFAPDSEEDLYYYDLLKYELIKINSNFSSFKEVLAINDNEIVAITTKENSVVEEKIVYFNLSGSSVTTIDADPYLTGSIADISNLEIVNGNILFSADYDETTYVGKELLTFNTSTGQIDLIKDINENGANSSNPSNFVKYNAGASEYLVFSASPNNSSDLRLWITDGTNSGTFEINNHPTLGFTEISDLRVIDTFIYFSGTSNNDTELYRIDLSVISNPTIEFIKNINPSGNGNPKEFTAFGSWIYFTADDGNGIELWRTDGTNAGTSIFDVDPTSSTGSGAKELIVVNGRLYMSAKRGAAGKELIALTNAGAFLTIDINQNNNYASGNSSPRSLITDGINLMCIADTDNSTKLIKYDTNTFSIYKYEDLLPRHQGFFTGAPGSFTPTFSILNNVLFFGSFTSNSENIELFMASVKTDCSPILISQVNQFSFAHQGNNWVGIEWNNNGNTYSKHILDAHPYTGPSSPANNLASHEASGTNDLVNGIQSGIIQNMPSFSNGNFKEYRVFITSICPNGGFIVNPTPIEVFTSGITQAPQNVTLSNITGSTVDINFTPINTTSEYNYHVNVYNRDASYFEDPQVFSQVIFNSPYNLQITGLQPNTDYDLIITENYTGGGLYSYSNPLEGLYEFSTNNILSIKNQNLNKFSLYPNPSSNYFSIKTENNLIIDKISIYSLDGKKVKEFNSVQNQYSIDELETGIYLIEMYSNNRKETLQLFKK
ncbi:MAG: T9SS type A sorting domain-containing protein [Flavobacteriaceae bacterium]|nr:T9SS type A sorting domain-containing protein [Flavobacteriaceae bacterium]